MFNKKNQFKKIILILVILLNVIVFVNLGIFFSSMISSKKLSVYKDSQHEIMRIKIYGSSNSKDENLIEDYNELDCQSGRILTEKGIYACPFLANDHRGRMGADFSDFGKKMYLETPFCQICAKNKEKVFSIDFKKFEN